MKLLVLILAIVLALLALGLFAPAAGADAGDSPLIYVPECETAKRSRFEPFRAMTTGPPLADERYVVTHYDIAIGVDFDTQTITGDVSIACRSAVDALTSIELDLHDNFDVAAVTRNCAPLGFFHDSHRLVVTLDRQFAADETFTLRVEYDGPPGQDGLLSFVFDQHDGAPIAATLSEPWFARDWWPCRETPDAKSTVDMALTVPAGMTAVSNGRLVEVDPAGEGSTWRFHSDYPITTYLVSATITGFTAFADEYAREDGGTMLVEFYAYPEDAQLALSAWQVVVPQLEYFRTVFGEYPFVDDKYGMAEFPFAGGMEHQTITSLGSCCVASENIIAHELAHQWWGDYVTCATWHDVWLNEGFATWSEALWYGHTHAPDGYRSFMSSLDPGSFPDEVYRYDISSPWTIFTSVPYRKGAWVLHMLRGVLGDETFFVALDAYRSAHAYGSATTEDLEAAFETTAGVELDWFFDEWVYGAGRPHYEVGWAVASNEVVVMVRQAQSGPPFRMPVELEIVTDEGSERHIVWNEESVAYYRFPINGAVSDVRFDPDDWILDLQTPAIVESPLVSSDLGGDRPRIDRVYPVPFSRSVEVLVSGCTEPGEKATCARLEIYDARGRRVATLLDAELAAGTRAVVWDGTTEQHTDAPSGVYFLRLWTPVGEESRRLVHLR